MQTSARDLSTIVIHHTASKRATVLELDAWHRARGFRRTQAARMRARPELTSIGYHRVIDLDGAVYEGRALDEVGAHARGGNRSSVGIVLVGKGRFTRAQWDSLERLIAELEGFTGRALRVLGHNQVTRGTVCPTFDVAAWRSSGRIPPEHVL